MTELLYTTDSYLRSCDAQIVLVTGEGVVLDRTPFYPGGGGQPEDHGHLVLADGSRRAVRGMKRHEGQILHLLAATEGAATGDGAPQSGLRKGDRVQAVIDWERRYQLMRTHTSLHILCGVVFRDLGAPVTGGNMEPLRGRLDFELESLDAERVGRIEAAVNEEIRAERPIEVRILPRDEAFRIPDLIRTKVNLLPPGIQEVRTVDIVGLDLQADGGTHVANTREVGRIRVIDYKSKGKGNKRIAIAIEDPE